MPSPRRALTPRVAERRQGDADERRHVLIRAILASRRASPVDRGYGARAVWPFPQGCPPGLGSSTGDMYSGLTAGTVALTSRTIPLEVSEAVPLKQ